MSITDFFSSFLPTVHADADPEPAAEEPKEEEAQEEPAEEEEEEEEPEDVRAEAYPWSCLLTGPL